MDVEQCFEILGVTSTTSLEEIKQAYRDLVDVWHPDRFMRNPRLQEKAENKLKEINTAYDTVLSHLSSNNDHDSGPDVETTSKPEEEEREATNTEAEGEEYNGEDFYKYFQDRLRKQKNVSIPRTLLGILCVILVLALFLFIQYKIEYKDTDALNRKILSDFQKDFKKSQDEMHRKVLEEIKRNWQ